MTGKNIIERDELQMGRTLLPLLFFTDVGATFSRLLNYGQNLLCCHGGGHIHPLCV